MRSLPLIGLLACLATLSAPLVRAAEPMAPSATAEAVMSGDPADFYESAASANQFEMEAGRLALDRSQDADVCRSSSGFTRPSYRTRSARLSSSTPRNVISRGSPGPAPTR